MSMSAPSWQSILQQIIKTPPERQRLATALGVTTMTLNRWANENSQPQRPHLIRLVQVVPPLHRNELMAALEENYPDLRSWLKDDSADQISTEFFAQVLSVRTTTIDSLRFWHITDLVLRQALEQLDPNKLGMSITLAQCMPPSEDGKIRTLRERAGKGTLPWTSDLEHLALFLGMESLAGFVIESGRPASVEDLSKDRLLPAYQSDHEVSAGAHPIWFGGRIAGCLLASSTQKSYFTQQRMLLLEAFSNLISLAFDPTDCYPLSMISLKLVPKPEIQRPILSTFRQRTFRKSFEAAQRQERISNVEAEQLVWKELEEILLHTPDEPGA